jgi:type IV pilus assembly protein PilB
MMKKINKPGHQYHYVRINPVEYRMEKIRQIQFNRKAGMSFASGLRSVNAPRPGCDQVGEIRDPETAGILPYRRP